MKLDLKVIHCILVLITFFDVPFSFCQKLEGVYSGTFDKKNKSVVELRGGGDLITGIIQTSNEKKWFFYGFRKGTSFDNYHLFPSDDSPFVKGEVKKDTLYLSLDARDSSYTGIFVRVRKKNEAEARRELNPNSFPRDSRLVGEWICIDDSAPEKYRSINYKMTLLENGKSIPDYEAAKRQYLKIASQHGLKVKPMSFSNIKINSTWHTNNDNQLIIIFENIDAGVEEITSSYQLRNDTLRLTNIKNYTSVFIKSKKKNPD
jgi:hypothetical protein